MHDDLWAGVGAKLDHAEFHRERMASALQPPERTAVSVALESSGKIIDTGWERALYAHLHSFFRQHAVFPK